MPWEGHPFDAGLVLKPPVVSGPKGVQGGCAVASLAAYTASCLVLP